MITKEEIRKIREDKYYELKSELYTKISRHMQYDADHNKDYTIVSLSNYSYVENNGYTKAMFNDIMIDVSKYFSTKQHTFFGKKLSTWTIYF